jgi:hypothetical protein
MSTSLIKLLYTINLYLIFEGQYNDVMKKYGYDANLKKKRCSSSKQAVI